MGRCTSRRAAFSGSFANSSWRSGVLTGPGQSAFTRTPRRANSTPSSRVIASTPPFDAVYETCEVAAPMTATNDAVLITEPPPPSSRCGIPCLQHRKTDLRLTSCTRCHASSDVSRTEPSSLGEIPALLKRTSTRPTSARTRAYMSRTAASSVTSTCSESSPGAPSARSPPTTRAPSAAKSAALAPPIPPDAPVMTHTLPSTRPGTSAPLGRVVDGLRLAVVLDRVRAELAAVARLLEAAERGRHAHRRVRVDRQHAALDGARHPQRLGAVARPDRARQAVDRVVGQRHRLLLVAERDHARDGPEDLLARGARVVADRAQDRGREPVAGAVGGGAADRHGRV